LPEEALYLVERGNLDLWWPTRSSFMGMCVEEEGDIEQARVVILEEKDEGVPSSLQAAYALLLGQPGQKGKVTLDRYNVYANLKRAGYVVFRAPGWNQSNLGERKHYQAGSGESPSIFTWLFGRLYADKVDHYPFGPLIKPGMYRSYNSIYRQLAIIPRHEPSAIPRSPSLPPEDPFCVVFELWKPTRIHTFAKSNPGIPDFRIAIVNARSSSVPSLTQITSLLASTPWDPPNPEWKGPSRTHQRLRHGWRNIVLAVIDEGVISYLRVGEAAFGEEKMYERFDRGSVQGTKRWGGAGRGGGGRGRGSGRSQK